MNTLEDSFKDQLGIKINIVKNDGYTYQEYETIENILKSLQKNINNIKEKKIIQYNDFQYRLSSYYGTKLEFNNKYIKNHEVNEVNIIGLSETQFINQIDQKVNLIEGRYFNKEEIDNNNYVIILSNCYKYNGTNVNVGDIIQLERIITDEYENEIIHDYVDYLVIGIFEKNQDLLNTNNYIFDNYETHMYIPYTTMIQEYNNITQYYNSLPNLYKTSILELNEIKMKLSNVDYKKRFYNNIDFNNKLLKQEENEASQYIIKESDDLYQNIMAPLSSLSLIALTLKLVSYISVCSLLGLSVFLFLKDRKPEIGILYSLGQKKITIIIHHIIETFVISILAISIAMFSGYYLGEIYATHMVENEIDSNKYIYLENNYHEELLATYEVNFDSNYVIQVYLSVTSIVIICSIIPAIYILRLKPKKILT